TSGRWIVVAIVVVGIGMGLVGFLFRGVRRLSLPLKPGSIVVVTCEEALQDRTTSEGPAVDSVFDASDVNATRFDFAIAPSSELAANLGALLTGRMPRENGLVRGAAAGGGDSLRADVPTLAEIAGDQGFVSAAFSSGAAQTSTAFAKASGLLRGFTKCVASPGSSDDQSAAEAAKWLAERGTSPSLVWLHLSGASRSAASQEPLDTVREFISRLCEQGTLDHAAIVVVDGLRHDALGGRVRLSMRLPVALVPLRIDARPVSLIDVAP